MREAFVEEGKLNEQIGRFKNQTMARSSREVAENNTLSFQI